MAQTWQAVVGGTTYNLNDGTISRLLPGVQGAGMPPARRLTQRSPQQHGHTDLGFRYDARQLRLPFLFDTTSLALADGRRDDLYDIFKSLEGTPVKLKVTRDDAAVRQLDCYVTGVVDMPDDLLNRQAATQMYVVTLEAADPMWYNPTQQSVSFTSADNLAWYRALGTIAAADVYEYVTSPTQGQAYAGSAIADTVPWSLYFRTTAPSSPSSTEYAFQFYTGAYSVLYVWGVLGTVDNKVQNTDGFAVSNFFSKGAAADYFLVMDGFDLHAYRDASYLGYLYAHQRGPHVHANSAWRGEDTTPTYPWTPSIPYGAIFKVALSANQRTSLIAAIDGTAISASKTITYGGSFAEYPVITITGPVTDPVLTNVSTDESLDFTGITIAALDTYTIDCRFGYKTVKNAAGTNKLADLTAASDLATFHLAADPEVSGGANAFTLTGTGTTGATTVTVAYYNRYVGL